jgi:hypothetical protein
MIAMAKSKKPTSRSARSSKLSHTDLAKGVHGKRREIRAAVHKVLQQAGFKGVTLHSMQFKVSAASLSSPGCSPACPPGQVCVLDSSGGEVQWVCVPEEGM